MADQSKPLKGVAFDLYCMLYTSAGAVIANPGGLAGRKVTDDDTTGAATTNAPAVVDTTGGICKLTLTAAEMDSDYVAVRVSSTDSGAVPFTAVIYPAAETLATAAALATVDGIVDDILLDTGTTLDDKLDAIKLKTDTIGALAVTIASPVAPDGTITIYAGDDYNADHGRELSFAISDSGHALGLDDPTAVVKLKCAQAEWTATGVTSTTAGYTVVLEPTAAETVLLTSQTQDYELEATLADGDVVTLARGELLTSEDITP